MIEREILKRMPDGYPYTWAEALGILRDNVGIFKDSELETPVGRRMQRTGFTWTEVRFRSSFLKNVLKTRKEYENRQWTWNWSGLSEKLLRFLTRTIASMRKNGEAPDAGFVSAAHFGILEEAERDGEDIKGLSSSAD